MKKRWWFLISLIIVVIIIFSWNAISSKEKQDSNIISNIIATNFEECVALGNQVMESFPRKCMSDGKVFVEEVSEVYEEESVQITSKDLVDDNDSSNSYVEWRYENNIWNPLSKAPHCSEPLNFILPADINLVTGVLYPGQIRGEFKAHGGLRFDDSQSSDVIVSAPVGAYLFRASQYLEQGNLQYMVDFVHPCGIMYRLDHLADLSPVIQERLKNLPQPREGESGTTFIEPLFIERGEVISKSAGMQGNVFFDLGVYDLRKQNNVEDLSGEQASYAVCWLDLLDDPLPEELRKLPTGIEGKESVYC